MSMSLRNYGYSTKTEYNERMDAIVRAINEYGVQSVYERLVKLGEFNPVMKEDAESVARIYELNCEEAVVEASEEAVVEASEEAVVEAEASEEAEEKPIWVAMKPEVDKGVRLSKSCKDAPKMKTELGDYDLYSVAHSRLQLLQDLADKHGIFAVLSLMATHLVTLNNPDQQKIMEGDMEALKVSHNEKMKAIGGPDWSTNTRTKEVMEERALCLEMLDTKFADY